MILQIILQFQYLITTNYLSLNFKSISWRLKINSESNYKFKYSFVIDIFLDINGHFIYWKFFKFTLLARILKIFIKSWILLLITLIYLMQCLLFMWLAIRYLFARIGVGFQWIKRIINFLIKTNGVELLSISLLQNEWGY